MAVKLKHDHFDSINSTAGKDGKIDLSVGINKDAPPEVLRLLKNVDGRSLTSVQAEHPPLMEMLSNHPKLERTKTPGQAGGRAVCGLHNGPKIAASELLQQVLSGGSTQDVGEIRLYLNGEPFAEQHGFGRAKRLGSSLFQGLGQALSAGVGQLEQAANKLDVAGRVQRDHLAAKLWASEEARAARVLDADKAVADAVKVVHKNPDVKAALVSVLVKERQMDAKTIGQTNNKDLLFLAVSTHPDAEKLRKSMMARLRDEDKCQQLMDGIAEIGHAHARIDDRDYRQSGYKYRQTIVGSLPRQEQSWSPHVLRGFEEYERRAEERRTQR